MKGKYGIYLILAVLAFIPLSCDHREGAPSIIDIITGNRNERSEEFYKDFLEQFCREHYTDLFRDFTGKRNYVENSLRIDSIRRESQREVTVFGKHDFKGRIIGLSHEEYLFEANIYESKKVADDFIVTFKKESRRLISGKTYWETGTKTVHYEP